MKQEQEKMLDQRFNAFVVEMANMFKTSTHDIENSIKNTLGHMEFLRESWDADRRSEIGR